MQETAGIEKWQLEKRQESKEIRSKHKTRKDDKIEERFWSKIGTLRMVLILGGKDVMSLL